MKVIGRQWSVVRGLRGFICVSLLFTFHFSPITLQAQGVPAPQRHTVSFESRNGEAFMVFVDGDVVNSIPQARVMVTDMSSQTHEVVVVMKRPEQKAAVMQMLPGEPVVTVYVDYDTRLNRLALYTPSYNLAEKEKVDYGNVKKSEEGVKRSEKTIDEMSVDVVSDDGSKLATEEDLAAMMLRMKDQTFDSDRLALGKVIVVSSRLTAEQIGKLASLLDYSASQVELLKYAYAYCVDQQNYYKAIDILTFNSDKRKVMDYIATQ